MIIPYLVLIILIGCGSKEVKKAKMYLENNEYEEAITLLEIEIKDNPKNAEAYFLLGESILWHDIKHSGQYYHDSFEFEIHFSKAISLSKKYKKNIGEAFYKIAKRDFMSPYCPWDVHISNYYYNKALEYYPSGKDIFAKELYEYAKKKNRPSLLERVNKITDKYNVK